MSPSTSASAASACRFGRFELQPDARQLLADGKPVTLGTRAFDLLSVLVERAGQLVSKNELLALVWPGLVVEENNLQVQVSTLRKLLGQRALATIPGRGYRFDLPVAREGPGAPHLTQVPGTPSGSVATASEVTREHAPTNLPSRLSLLFGRAQDVEAVSALLERHAVVTIAGAGGIGKTRLAQAVAAQLVATHSNEYPDGIWWVELAPLTDGTLVASAVARVLGTQLTADRPPLATIAALLASRRLLLALDNCEHLTDAVAQFVAAVGAAAPGVRMLLTSQESLKTHDEQVYRVGALSVVPGDAAAGAERAGAVELFVARAQAADPHFALTPANTPAVIEICRRLDGIPLAIELAAARVPLLGAEGLRTRLGERFSVLTAGARVVLRRHQTLRATLEWSHGLLTPDEQTVFRRLGVFAGGFSLEAAQHVAHDPQIDRWAALDHLGALVDKSLVLAEGDPVPRYRLLETTRAYAIERLAEAGETPATLRRHAEAMLELLSVYESDDRRWQFTLDDASAAAAELDNLRAALAWVTNDPAGADLAFPLAGVSYRVWYSAMLLAEGTQRCLALRDRIRESLPRADAALFWLTLARVGLYSTRRECHDAARHAADLYRELGDAARLHDALICFAVMGVRFASTGELEEAVAEAAGVQRPDWPARQRASLQFARFRWLARLGRFEEALACGLEQVAISREGANTFGAHFAMSNVVAAENQLGRPESALEHARASIAALEASGAGGGAGHLYLGVMSALLLLDRVDEARAAGRTSHTLLLREGDEMRTLPGLALCAVLSGRVDDAARIDGFARAQARRNGAIPEATWTRLSERIDREFAARLTPAEIETLRAEGATLQKEQAFRLALE